MIFWSISNELTIPQEQPRMSIKSVGPHSANADGGIFGAHGHARVRHPALRLARVRPLGSRGGSCHNLRAVGPEKKDGKPSRGPCSLPNLIPQASAGGLRRQTKDGDKSFARRHFRGISGPANDALVVTQRSRAAPALGGMPLPLRTPYPRRFVIQAPSSIHTRVTFAVL